MYGIWTIVPPVLVILIALIKKDVVASLLIGLCTASFIINGKGFLEAITANYMMEGWTEHASLLITVMIVGIMMGQINATGGFQALSEKLGGKVRTERGARVLSWILCMICATDDGMATIGAGTIALNITDRFKVSRVKLALIVSSTGSAFLSMMPYSMYILFGAGLLENYTVQDGYICYLQSIPWNFYVILSILSAGAIAAGIFPDFRKMKSAEERAKNTNTGETATNGMFEKPVEDIRGDMKAFFLPIVTMLIVFVIQYMISGTFQLAAAALCGCIVAFAYPVIKGQMKFCEISGRCFEGFKSSAPMFVILFLAFSFAAAVNDLGFGVYVTEIFQGGIRCELLPVLAFLLSGVIAYCTGSFASGLIIITPVMLPLAVSAGIPLPLIFAACMGGSQFGDQSSPVSDIFIMSSMASGVDVARSAEVLLPYKLVWFGISAALYLAAGFLI